MTLPHARLPPAPHSCIRQCVLMVVCVVQSKGGCMLLAAWLVGWHSSSRPQPPPWCIMAPSMLSCRVLAMPPSKCELTLLCFGHNKCKCSHRCLTYARLYVKCKTATLQPMSLKLWTSSHAAPSCYTLTMSFHEPQSRTCRCCLGWREARLKASPSLATVVGADNSPRCVTAVWAAADESRLHVHHAMVLRYCLLCCL